MRRFFLKVVIFVAIFFAIDAALGYSIGLLHSKVRSGDHKRYTLINDSITSQVLIFGSSRAIHHYNPEILADSLHKTVYNCGSDGNGILLEYMQLRNVLSRYTPQLVVYDFLPTFDALASGDNSKYLNWQRPFYGRNAAADSVFGDISDVEPIKMKIYSYRYNSKLPQLLFGYLAAAEPDNNGFRPEDGVIPDDFPEPPVNHFASDPIKLKYLDKFVVSCREAGVPLVFVVSPYYFKSTADTFADLFAVAEKYNVPVLYHYDDARFIAQSRYFYDSAHLNSTGANFFTSIIASELRHLFAIE